MSTMYLGIEGNNVVTNTLDNIKENIQNSSLDIRLVKQDKDFYSMSNDDGFFGFLSENINGVPHLLGESTRYGSSSTELLESILIEIFGADKVLSEDDSEELIELGIYEDFNDKDEI
jgi:hypothetical protein